MAYHFSTKSLERLEAVDSRLKQLMENAITISPIDFGIPPLGGRRTAEEQHELYLNGFSRCDGYSLLSRHQEGKAIDVYAYVNGKASWDKIHLSLIAGVILAESRRMHLNIRWGGTFGSKVFKGWDLPHFELLNFKAK